MTFFRWTFVVIVSSFAELLTWEWCHPGVSKKHINLLCVTDFNQLFPIYYLEPATFCPQSDSVRIHFDLLPPSGPRKPESAGPALLSLFSPQLWVRGGARNTQPLLWLRLRRLLVTKRETKSAREEKENAQNCTCAEFKQQTES